MGLQLSWGRFSVSSHSLTRSRKEKAKFFETEFPKLDAVNYDVGAPHGKSKKTRILPLNSSINSGSISRAIAQNSQLDEEAAQLIWNRFFENLCRFASKKIYKRHRRLIDPEDIASSAMFALLDGIKNERFHSVSNRDELWQMLVMIASRKAISQARHLDREKRGGVAKQEGDAALNGQRLEHVAEYIVQSGDPAKFIEIEMTCRELLAALPHDKLREIALMRLAGFSNQEISVKFACSKRTIDRKLLLIREVWNDLQLDDE